MVTLIVFGRQIYLDCAFLESLHIIDYSLLLGVHFRAPGQLNDILEPPNSMSDQESVSSVDGRYHCFMKKFFDGFMSLHHMMPLYMGG